MTPSSQQFVLVVESDGERVNVGRAIANVREGKQAADMFTLRLEPLQPQIQRNLNAQNIADSNL
jgi:hypothetical protein